MYGTDPGAIVFGATSGGWTAERVALSAACLEVAAHDRSEARKVALAKGVQGAVVIGDW